MGVPGFFTWLIKNIKKLGAKNLILEKLEKKIKWLMLDTNCLLHPCVAYVLEQYNRGILEIDASIELRIQLESYIWKIIVTYIDDMIEQVKPEYIYIAIDGVAPMGKIIQQRQRRYRFLFDKKNKFNNNKKSEKELDNLSYKTIIKSNGIEESIIPISSIELTPGTDYMERIHKQMEDYMKNLEKKGIKYVYSSYHDEGEGEHKILQYIKKNISLKNSIVIDSFVSAFLFFFLVY